MENENENESIFSKARAKTLEGRKKHAQEEAKKNAILFGTEKYISIQEAGDDYSKLLQTKEWKNRRLEILKRDNFSCQECMNSKLLENTDCKFYLEGRVPLIKHPKSWSLTLLNENLETYNTYFRGDIINLPRNIRLFVEKKKGVFSYLVAAAISKDNHSDERILNNINLEKIQFCSNNIPMSKNQNLEFIFVKGLHIHHKYYILNNNPWEYKDDALTTFCEHCHDEFHKATKVKVYLNNELEGIPKLKDRCYKCYGKGHIPEYHYYMGGICFACNGRGYDE